MRKLCLLICSLLAASLLPAQQAATPVTLTDMLKIKTVGGLTANKDGSRVAFTVTSIEPDETKKQDYRYVTQLYMVQAAGGRPVQLTTAKEGAAQPAWSPDGRQLAFVRNADGKPQLFLLSMDGGEPRQLTNYRHGASNPRWSPDGIHIAFTSTLSLNDYLKDTLLNARGIGPGWPSERPGLRDGETPKPGKTRPNPDGDMAAVRAWLDKNAADHKAIVLNRLNFQNEMNISSEMNFGQLCLVNVHHGDQVKTITQGLYRFNNPVFTPDGKQVVFSGDVDSTEHPDRSLESEIFIADIDGKNFRVLLGGKDKTYTGASLSPAGKWLVFQEGTTSFVDIPRFAMMPFGGSAKDIVYIPFERNRGNYTWSGDERHLYFTAQSNGGVPLYRLDMNSRKLEQLSGFESGITSFALVGDNIIFSRTEPRNPSELYMANAMMKNEKQLSAFNDWVKSRKLSLPEKKTFVNEKGMTVEYWVMKPAQYQPGKKCPLLLEIHGGPSAMWGPGEASMWHEFQYFCGKGYGVVYANPRGSGGYDAAFLRGNIRDWGAGPSMDVLTALDKTVAEGWADTGKLLITGGSYAGYLVAWIIAHDKRFAAACSQRGVYDLATFFGEGNAWRLVPNYFGGYPWEAEVKAVLQRESPITYVDRITTPYIIFHGANDRRTGFVQAEMMYRSLKVLGRPVEFVVHPNATHEITRSGDNRQRMDQMLRTWEFFERWIR